MCMCVYIWYSPKNKVMATCWTRMWTAMWRKMTMESLCYHDVIKWKNFPRYGPFVRGIHRSPVNSPHKGQWHGALMFSLIRRLSKQWWGWWFETPLRSLCRHLFEDGLPENFVWLHPVFRASIHYTDGRLTVISCEISISRKFQI